MRGALTLQELVDGLSRRLGVPVTLEDAGMRLLAHSAHGEGTDRHRQDLILSRQAPAWVPGWMRALGAYDAEGAVRLPAVPEREQHARVVVGIRWQGALLGWIFLLDRDESIDEEAVAVLERAAADAAVVLGAHARTEQHRRDARGAVVDRLLDPDRAVREAAARDAVEADLLRAGPVRAVAIDLAGLDPRARAEAVDGLQRVADLLAEGEAHVLARGDRALLLAVALDPLVARPERLVARVHESLAHAGGVPPVGVGEVHPSLVATPDAVREADLAALLAARVPEAGPIAHWPDLGAYRVLLLLPQPVDPAVLHAGVARMAAEAPDQELLDTVEVFLDEAGRATRAASLLHVHRGTLYYRLKRFEELAGCDLDDGADRLAVHLALKALRLRG